MPNRLESVDARVAKGAAWMVLFKIVDRSIGLVSTVVLARLLVPADFGLVALAGSLIAMLSVLGAVGLDMALIQRSDARREHYDSAWTFYVVFGLAMALVIVLTAPAVASFYDDPRMVGVMQMLALAHAINGFENIGVVAFRKELAFEREFRYRVIRRVISTFVVTLPLALWLQSYWALLIGNVVGAAITVVLSYLLHSYRPRLSFAAIGPLMKFSKWFLFTSIVEFLYGRMASLMIGRWSGAASLGVFTLASDLVAIATQHISAPVHRAVFPGYAQIADDRAQLRSNYVNVLAMLVIVILPATVGLCVLAEPAVLVILGEQWAETVPLVQILAIEGALTVFLSTAHYVNLAVGMARSTSLVLGIHAAMTIPMMVWAVPNHGAWGAAVSMLVASVITTPFNFILLRRAIAFGAREVSQVFARPLVATAAMAGFIATLSARWTLPASMPDRIAYGLALVVIGVLVYAGMVLSMWRLQGRPNGPESSILSRVPGVLGTVRARMGLP